MSLSPSTHMHMFTCKCNSLLFPRSLPQIEIIQFMDSSRPPWLRPLCMKLTPLFSNKRRGEFTSRLSQQHPHKANFMPGKHQWSAICGHNLLPRGGSLLLDIGRCYFNFCWGSFCNLHMTHAMVLSNLYPHRHSSIWKWKSDWNNILYSHRFDCCSKLCLFATVFPAVVILNTYNSNYLFNFWR